MGVTIASNSSYPNLCYKCHSSTGNPNAGTNKDYYGSAVMTGSALQVGDDAARPNKHPLASGKHVEGEGTGSGWNGGTKRHSTCMDCHDVHAARSGSTTNPSYTAVRTTNTVPPVAGALRGVWGVNITGPTAASAVGTWAGGGTTTSPDQPTYSAITQVNFQWQLCLKCHSRHAYSGFTTPTVTTDTANQTGQPQTDVGRDFNPSKTAYHPIFKAGRNQPETTANANWDDTGNTDRRRLGGIETGLGLSNTFVDGWNTKSLVVCTDCHGSSNAAGSNGPHGSNNAWILRGKDDGIKVTLVGGTVRSPNSGVSIAGNYCLNCHRADTYLSWTGDSELLSRMSHSQLCNPPTIVNDGGDEIGLAVRGISSCYHCHGMRQPTGQPQSGAMHGSSFGNFNGTTPMSYRFINGGSWQGHTFADDTGDANCWTIAADDNYSNCTQHTSAKTISVNYYYNSRAF